MIRNVRPQDACAISRIYNFYIANTTVTFEIDPVSEEEMRGRIRAISGRYPYLVDETDGEITGYCYAHAWKERAAYRQTVETTVYVAHGTQRKGIGNRLMQSLMDGCRQAGFHSLIACITEDNLASRNFHEKLGFRLASRFHEVGFKFGKQLGVVDYQLMLE